MKRMYSELNEIYDQIEAAINDKEFLKGYGLRDMALSDWTTGVNTAIERGIEKGIEKGAMQSKIEVAKNSLNKGLSIETIHEITGLDIETIQQCQTSKKGD
jgi:predicted transposase/invertase (TIGR01784 family)